MQTKDSWIEKFCLGIVVCVIGFPLLILVTAVAIPLIGIARIARLGLSRLYRIRHSGQLYLVVDGQNGWRALAENNIAPAAPRGIEVIWHDSPESRRFRTYGLDGFQRQRPFIVRLTWRGIDAISIHEALLPLKAHGKRDPQVQTGIRKIIEQATHQIIADE